LKCISLEISQLVKYDLLLLCPSIDLFCAYPNSIEGPDDDIKQLNRRNFTSTTFAKIVQFAERTAINS